MFVLISLSSPLSMFRGKECKMFESAFLIFAIAQDEAIP